MSSARESIASRREKAWAALERSAPVAILLVCSAVLLAETLFGDRALFARDVFNYYFPTRLLVAKGFALGHWPLWDPTQQLGLPLLADLHAAALYPPNLIYQWLDFPRAYGWLVWLHDALFGLGAYCLLRRIGLGARAALAGGLTVALAGYTIGLFNEGPLLEGGAYVPWVLFLLAGKPTKRATAALAVLLAAQALSGDPQSVLFTGICAGVWIAWSDERRSRVMMLVTGGLIAGLIAAAQLVPAFGLLTQSTRAHPTPAFFNAFTFQPLRTLELLLPLPFGRFDQAPFFWAHFAVRGPGGWPFALSGYLGAAGLALALLGCRKNRNVGVGVSLFVLGLLLAFGHYGPLGWLLHVPPFRFFRYPEKYLFLTVIGAAVLAGEGVQGLEAGVRGRWRVVLLAASAVGLCVIAWLLAEGVGQSLLGRHTPDAAQSIGAAVRTSALWFAVALALAGLARSRPRVAAGLAVGAIALDLLVAGGPLVFLAPSALYHSRPALADLLLSHAPVMPFRYLRDFSVERYAPETLAPDGLVHRDAWQLQTLKSDLGGVFGLEESSGYGGVSLARWETVAVGLFDRPALHAAVFQECFALAGVGATRFDADPGFTRAFADSRLGVAVFQARSCLPRIRPVELALPAQDATAAVGAMRSAGFDPTRMATVEGSGSQRHFGGAAVHRTRFSAGNATAEVEAQAPGALLAFSESYYPGWAVSVDGAPRKLEILDGTLMGVEVPAGRHTVAFRFSPPLGFGFGLSALGLLAAIALAFQERLTRFRASFRDGPRPEPTV